MKQIVKKIWMAWREKGLSDSQSRSTSTLQRAIERELTRLKEENTGLHKNPPQRERRQSAHFSAPSL